MKRSRVRRTASCWAMTIALSSACASTPEPEPEPSAELYYNQAMDVLKGNTVLFFLTDVDSQKAVDLLQRVIDDYPYSELATEAELKIGDIRYDQFRYEEAQSYYQDFVEAHPKNPKVPYALYRNGLSYFAQIRDPDRDQKPTNDAIKQFEVVLDKHPESEYAGPAREKLRECKDQLAQRHAKIANYYYREGVCHAAIKRFELALDEYPEHTDNLQSRARLGLCLRQMERQAEGDRLLGAVLTQELDEELLEELTLQLGADMERLRTLGLEAIPGPGGANSTAQAGKSPEVSGQ
jgi:outer membrane protein assembly factor BamD